jgi:hypothetical protein
MKRLRETERRKRPEEWRNEICMLHHDTTPAHTSPLVREFLVKHEVTVVPNRPTLQIWSLQKFFVPEVEIHYG